MFGTDSVIVSLYETCSWRIKKKVRMQSATQLYSSNKDRNHRRINRLKQTKPQWLFNLQQAAHFFMIINICFFTPLQMDAESTSCIYAEQEQKGEAGNLAISNNHQIGRKCFFQVIVRVMHIKSWIKGSFLFLKDYIEIYSIINNQTVKW